MTCNALELTHERLTERQERAYAWAESVYGPARVRQRRYQAFRFLEEAMELCQTQGLSLEDFVRCARYVSERKVGDTKVEMGDVRICLDIMAENLGLSLDHCHTTALNRVHSLDPEKCKTKDDAKIAAGLI
ncbi:hypothetical protein KIKIMORA_02370 [Brevundimonas phage vB_BpoS-Kikimora]|uniref:Uncharacterized protein n=1 Tax=Brevundimonas phage vB_BpoS-Kikimora TaxID=2948601 RepID=A0A9E7SKC6_9CAUD|nr:hypothetical protein KIKIMORA_02370 [Brevundimonas phage vB_BpoS-Kikimora]